MLAHYCNDRLTDKNTVHSYIDLYQALLAHKKDTATHILEVGIGPYQPNGGSILMWAGYFQNAEVHALDIISINDVHSELISHPRIHLHTKQDAYNPLIVKNTFSSKGMKFDMVLDDGPHTLDSMTQFIRLYSPLLKDDGILIIEDVQAIEWMDTLREATPDALKAGIEVYDRRSVKGRYDDLVFVIHRTPRVASASVASA